MRVPDSPYPPAVEGSAWSLMHVPAVNTIATVTRGAPGAGKLLVVTSIHVSFHGLTAAALAAARFVSLTAPGVVWGGYLSILAGINGGDLILDTPLVLPEDTPATLAFASPGGLNTGQTAYLAGYVADVSALPADFSAAQAELAALNLAADRLMFLMTHGAGLHRANEYPGPGWL